MAEQVLYTMENRLERHVENDGSAKDKQNKSKTSLIINYLPETMSQEEVRSLFSNIGEVESCKLIKNKTSILSQNSRDLYSTESHSLGYAFVNFWHSEDAEKAIKTLDGLKIQQKTIKVSYSRPSSPSIKGANLYVSGFPRNMTLDDLNAMFSPYGQIITSRILRDNITVRQYSTGVAQNLSGLSKGVGFVRFSQRLEALHAIQELDGSIPKGSTEPMTVKFPNAKTAPAVYLPRRARIFNRIGWCIFVFNLVPNTEDSVLWQLFDPFGAVLRVQVTRDLETGKCKGYGFVTMMNFEDAFRAIQALNGYKLGNRVLQVSFKTNKRTS